MRSPRLLAQNSQAKPPFCQKKVVIFVNPQYAFFTKGVIRGMWLEDKRYDSAAKRILWRKETSRRCVRATMCCMNEPPCDGHLDDAWSRLRGHLTYGVRAWKVTGAETRFRSSVRAGVTRRANDRNAMGWSWTTSRTTPLGLGARLVPRLLRC